MQEKMKTHYACRLFFAGFGLAALLSYPSAVVAAMDGTPVTPVETAADDFGGGGFPHNSHSALRGDPEMSAEEASEIEPAAGPKASPASPSEKELEDEYGTDVNQTVIDRGDSEVKTRDRFGSDDVGLFYDHKRDERVNDEDDAIGVEFRLLEFD